ncbi:hypothetical protein CFP65_4946 [Kitasatospora sp. MMS16-BH015]|uniref:hypothetical protein n=1 Tax=Kitasatospora sp. MMS16-BH015 TaxID=2018025 RepID=UPI000CA35FD5|nr:hypothetical protein [Kitasatospora sp. MMS16-BH015]AUG79662.1 hypothetical protein CFP65_4946 [Kitasatospora sp. MMS16-BH015]
MAAGDWVVAGVGAGVMAGSWALSLVVGGGRSYWEWVPFMFGLVEVIGAVPRALGASAEVLLFTDTAGRAVWSTAAFMVVRAGWFGARGLVRRVRAASGGG